MKSGCGSGGSDGYNSAVRYWNDKEIILTRQGTKEEKKPEQAVCGGTGRPDRSDTVSSEIW